MEKSVILNNTLKAVIVLPSELFQPYASATTAILVLEKGVKHDFESPVFFAQIENDGLKLKRGTRVRFGNSQIEDVLSAYKKGKTIDGLCCTSIIEENSAWRPGEYIPSRPFSDDEIFEEVSFLIRSKTSVSIKYAPSFCDFKKGNKKRKFDCS